jgi:hypothetical protein
MPDQELLDRVGVSQSEYEAVTDRAKKRSLLKDTEEPVDKHHYEIKSIDEGRITILTPPGKHKATLIWVHGFTKRPYPSQRIFMDESLCKLPSGVKIVLLTPSQYMVEKYDEDFIVNWFNNRNQSDSACPTLDQFIN